MKYLVVEFRYGNGPVSFDNQVRPLKGINICAETHDLELANRLVKFYNKIHKNYHIEVQAVFEDGDITEQDIDKVLNEIQSNR